MTLDLPAPVREYVAAKDTNDPATIAACFHEEAWVHDEAEDIIGRANIQKWASATIQKYKFTMTPTAWKQEDADTGVLTATLVGNFPGSPVDLDYRMMLKDGKIYRLEIE